MRLRKLKHQQKLVLFIGSPRTGSTFVGQVLNYHPECLISNEFRFLNKVLDQSIPIKSALKGLRSTALEHFNSSLENTEYFGKTIDRYQSKWSSFEELKGRKEFQKSDNIGIIGDKKAGGNIVTINNNLQRYFRKLSHLEIKYIYVQRNPIDAARSYVKSHNFSSFETALSSILDYMELTENFLNQHSVDCFRLPYEHFSIPTVSNLLTWLGLTRNPEWIKSVCSLYTPGKSIYTEQEVNTLEQELLSRKNTYLHAQHSLQ